MREICVVRLLRSIATAAFGVITAKAKVFRPQSFCGDSRIHASSSELKNVTSPNSSVFAVKAHAYLKFNFADLFFISAYTVTYIHKMVHLTKRRRKAYRQQYYQANRSEGLNKKQENYKLNAESRKQAYKRSYQKRIKHDKTKILCQKCR